tara:strand:- start:624 stop:779 length:156 start_codon:yes stop_codon:yes gene_type:complete
MKFLLLCAIFFLSSCSDGNKYSWYNGTVDQAIQSIKNHPDKLVMLDFYSDG